MSLVLLTDPNPYQVLAERYLKLIKDSINNADLTVPAENGVVMVRPAEDCCPDLKLWVDNIRSFDIAFPNSLQENRLLIHFGVAFDLFVRFGHCYIESDDKGGATDIGILQDWTSKINAYINPIYTIPLSEIARGCVEEFGECGQTFLPSNLNGYNLGGCAGYEYLITIGLFT